MPAFDMVVSIAEHENIAVLAPAANRAWPLKLRCGQCNEVNKNFVFVDAAEQCETDGGGVRNSVVKCNFCKTILTIDVLPAAAALVDVEKAEDGGRQAESAIVRFDVRGGVPEELRLDDQWTVTSIGGEVFEGVDFSEDWYDVEEKTGAPVSLSEVTVSFVKAKTKK